VQQAVKIHCAAQHAGPSHVRTTEDILIQFDANFGLSRSDSFSINGLVTALPIWSSITVGGCGAALRKLFHFVSRKVSVPVTTSISGVARHPSGKSASLTAAQMLISALLVMLIAITAAEANPKYAGIVIDARTGKTLYSNSADAPRYPGLADQDDDALSHLRGAGCRPDHVWIRAFPISANAAAEASVQDRPSLGIRRCRSNRAIKALVTKSANDAATAMGEFLGGSEAEIRPHDRDAQGAPARHVGHDVPQRPRPPEFRSR
jgi:hypothetical protein